MKIHRTFTAAAFLTIALALAALPAPAQSSCEALAQLKLTNATITSAKLVPAGPFAAPLYPGMPSVTMNLPAFCRVAGVATPTSDSKIEFEVWLPVSTWNGKFEQLGNGGFAGSISEASLAAALLRGFATAATDDGHHGEAVDATWALGHPEKVIDFGYRAVHETSVQAAAIIHAFYAKPPAHSYFVGCSDGGREALMEAQRYPNDFIGIIAGAPANYWTHLLVTAVWIEQALRNDPASALPPAKLALLQHAALSACAKLPGAKDGVLEDPRACHFDPSIVECKGADGPDCLTHAQVVAAKKIYSGPENPRTGAQIFPGYVPGTEAVPGNWAVWLTGAAPDGSRPSLAWLFGNSFFSDIVFADPKWDFRSLNFDSDVKLSDEKFASILNSNDPNLAPFQAHGGKLIQYHGWGDAAITPLNSIDYFDSVQARMALKGGTANFYRLFMVPGMSHCGGGIGATDFGQGLSPGSDAEHDVVQALDRWVTKGVAPSSLIASGTVPNDPAKTKMTHLLCPYPQGAHYKGSGDVHDASNFVCRLPSR
jgi:hypothetical protein